MDWTEIVITIATLLFTGIVIPLVNAIIDNFKARTKNELTNTALTEAQNVITNAVKSVNEDFVDRLKKNGEFTAEDGARALREATLVALGTMSSETKRILSENEDKLIEVVQSMIKAKVADVKLLNKG